MCQIRIYINMMDTALPTIVLPEIQLYSTHTLPPGYLHSHCLFILQFSVQKLPLQRGLPDSPIQKTPFPCYSLGCYTFISFIALFTACDYLTQLSISCFLSVLPVKLSALCVLDHVYLLTTAAPAPATQEAFHEWYVCFPAWHWVAEGWGLWLLVTSFFSLIIWLPTSVEALDIIFAKGETLSSQAKLRKTELIWLKQGCGEPLNAHTHSCMNTHTHSHTYIYTNTHLHTFSLLLVWGLSLESPWLWWAKCKKYTNEFSEVCALVWIFAPSKSIC